MITGNYFDKPGNRIDVIPRTGMMEEVASPGIEPGSGASETLILSIVRRGLFYQSGYIAAEDFYGNGQQYYAKKFTNGNHSCGA